MKLSTREDISAPVATVFEAVTDFERFRRHLLSKGFQVNGLPQQGLPVQGSTWHSKYQWRGRGYDIESRLVSFENDQGFAIESQGKGVVCLTVVDLIELAKQRTRLSVSLKLKPTTLASRLLIQSVRIAKPRLNKKLKSRVSNFAAEFES